MRICIDFCLYLWQCPPAAWCSTRALTPPTATASCCHPLTTSLRPSSPHRWHLPPSNHQQQLLSDCHNQPARCNSSPACHHSLTQTPAQLPPGEKTSQAQDRKHGKMMLALLKSTAPPKKKKTQQTLTLAASSEWPDILLWLPKMESQQCQDVDGALIHSAFIKLGLYEPVSTRLNHVGKSKAGLPKKGHHL